ncbi:TetR/AcrR family transcriptional regulator [Cryobacterium arcticum]|uniref:Regulatory protein TetR n=1 Tax=Cryobacterium arcticum TaxID=670052 RepID=A0A1B1BF94_9MICO|nr:TetR family transcriptional regulator [Cryobacterium arcticum]ANP71183.1 Regulatory protein TetR [Cryobacterium arcticum]
MTRLALADRRAALIDAAVRVIARHGLAAATTRAIVAEAGMPLGSFHYAFDSRDDLLAAVIDTVTTQEHDAAVAAVAALPGDDGSSSAGLADTLRQGLDRYLDLLVADPQREQALLELSLYALRQNPPTSQPSDQYRAYYRAAEHSLRLAATACGREWSVPLARAARLLVTLTDGITSTWLADRDTEAARESVVFAADALARLAAPARPAATSATTAAPRPISSPTPPLDLAEEQPRAD